MTVLENQPSGRRLYFGWWMVLASGIGLIFGYIPTTTFTFGVFMPSLVQTFGWTRGQVSMAFSVSLLGMVFAMPMIGRLVDRLGARRVILPSALIFGLSVASLRFLNDDIWRLYGLFLVMGLVGAGTAPLAYSSVIAHWFDRRRGLALGLTMVGLGLGSSIMPSASEWLIASFGWRNAYTVLGLAVVLITIPVVGLFLRDRPDDMLALRPDGDVPGTSQPHTEKVPGMTIREVWRSPDFWLMCIVFFLMGMVAIGCLIHLAPMITDAGASAREAAMATSAVGVSLILGRVVAGYLLDRIFAVRIAVVFFAGVGVAILLFLSGVGNWLAFVAALLLGMGIGAEADLIPYLVSRYFGLKSFTECYGYTNASFTLGGVLGPWLMGTGHDTFGSYFIVLCSFGAATIVSSVMIARLRPYRFNALDAH